MDKKPAGSEQSREAKEAQKLLVSGGNLAGHENRRDTGI